MIAVGVEDDGMLLQLSLTPEELQALTFVATPGEGGEAGAFRYTVDDGWYTPAEQTIELKIDVDSDVDDTANLCRVWRRWRRKGRS